MSEPILADEAAARAQAFGLFDDRQRADFRAFLARHPGAVYVPFGKVTAATMAGPEAMREMPVPFWSIGLTGSFFAVGGRAG